ncbi:adenylosuccinate lyase [Eubacteriales bacterium OttesenSCG-928-M02]|nr:adenylosuccinate lyase [Eubacteriales bacterium OttesenSCG-928-M02]
MKDRYENPLNERYASREMQYLFSPLYRAIIWRKLWVALAAGEMALGLPITPGQVDELKAHVEDIDFDVIAARERQVRHDVMAHIYAYGKVAPGAAGIIHLGATSCYVTDNGDLIIYKEALLLLRKKLLFVLGRLRAFALRYKGLPTLGYTHLQPAQPVTVGKRATLWMHELLLDLEQMDALLKSLKLLGNKGTTGTQASFLELFDGDEAKVDALERYIVEAMEFEGAYPVAGQTYSRKVDDGILGVLGGIAQSATKFATDLRLLMHMGEIAEPFEEEQIGSSAMAYKRNPMRSERMTSLSRHIITLRQNTANTAANQWMERTLDDSANRRITMGEAFLGVDAILELYANITDGLVVYEGVIQKHLEENLPFLATENILMEAVKKGGDRQQVHERIRVHSQVAITAMKLEGKDCDLVARLGEDAAIPLTEEEIAAMLLPKNFIGRSEGQVEDFIREYVDPVLLDGPAEDVLAGITV